MTISVTGAFRALAILGFAWTIESGRMGVFRNDTHVQQSSPSPTHLEAVAFDAARRRLVLFGGSRLGNGTFADLNETWEWDGTRWHAISTSNSRPSARRGHALGYDPNDKRVWLVGGVRRNPGAADDEVLDDSWAYDGQRWERGPDAPVGSGHRLIYDAARRSMLLLAHAGRETSRPQQLLIYRRSPNGWMVVDSAGPLGTTQAAFDVKRSVLVVPVLDDSVSRVWEWNGTTWSVTSVSGPSARSRYALAYDQRSGTTILVGGRENRTRNTLGDVWAWDGSRWSQVSDTGAALEPKASASLVADVTSERLLLYGGTTPRGLVTDIWIWSRSGWTPWRASRD
jgi:hypothetical protein